MNCEKNYHNIQKVLRDTIKEALQKHKVLTNSNVQIILTNLNLSEKTQEIDMTIFATTKQTKKTINQIVQNYKKSHNFTSYLLYKIMKNIYKKTWIERYKQIYTKDSTQQLTNLTKQNLCTHLAITIKQTNNKEQTDNIEDNTKKKLEIWSHHFNKYNILPLTIDNIHIAD